MGLLFIGRRSRTPCLAVVRLVGILILAIEMIVISVDQWHPWPEHNTSMRKGYMDGADWPDGSLMGCATVYQNYPSGSWHVDIYFGRSWFYMPKGFDFSTKQEAIDEANKHCKQ